MRKAPTQPPPAMTRPDIKLGDKAKDTITGFTGIVVAITDWLNGCRRITIQPQALHDGNPVKSEGFDVEQLEAVSNEPEFGAPTTGGPKPAPTRNPDPAAS